ncbi:MAG: sigma-70 family RNA polymerase sigma factor [Actinobacteria bacterium]|nr:MAG: sigma-70 family RNA polymerase sigma factor [Actinomycetota bacterium]
MADPEDRELVEQFARGDSHAFDTIVQRYEQRVYAIALRMTGNVEDARDAMQDVFLSALRALRSFRGDAQLSTWFHRVAVNASLDMLRKRKRHVAEPIEEAGERPSDEVGPEDAAARAARAAEVQRALLHVSADHRAVLVLHDLQDLDYAQTAAALDIPVGTVKSRLHRARMEMAALLGHLRETGSTEETEPTEGPEPLKEGR